MYLLRFFFWKPLPLWQNQVEEAQKAAQKAAQVAEVLKAKEAARCGILWGIITSWESKGTPLMPPRPPGNNALIRDKHPKIKSTSQHPKILRDGNNLKNYCRWFPIFFYFHPENWGNDQIWLEHIFQKPPTRKWQLGKSENIFEQTPSLDFVVGGSVFGHHKMTDF